MSTTSKGAPYPEDSDSNSAPTWLKQLAEWTSDRPGVAAVTAGQRDLLVGAEIWEGRVIYNLDADRLEVNKTGTAGAGNWTALGEAVHTHAAADLASGTLSLARLPVAASGTSSTTQVVRADDSRLSNARTPADGSVSNIKLADGAVSSSKLGNLAVTNAKLVDAAVTAEKLDGAAVTTDKIEDGAVTAPKLASGVVTKPPNVQTFTANGTWNKPANAARVRVILIGGGGRGATAVPNARGGGGGALIDATFLATQLPGSLPVTVGAAGTDPTSSGGATRVTIGLLTYIAGGGRGGSAGVDPGKGGRAQTQGQQAGDPAEDISLRYGGPGGDANPTGTPAPAPGAGAGASFEDPGYYRNGKGAGGITAGPGSVYVGLPGGGNNEPGGGGSAGANGYPGAACFITYFD